MSLALSDYDYPLPEELIAKYPLPRREDSRMMVVDRKSGAIEHRPFAELPSLLQPGDLAVLNNTRVIPARVFSDDGRVELLFLEETGPQEWKCMVKPGKRMRAGQETRIGGVEGKVLSIEEDGTRIVRFSGRVDLEKHGRMPLPPYIDRESEISDTERYQTVFAQTPGAVAAPTAGLHFTPEILARIPHVFITLHVGAGTFRPVQSESIDAHRMHAERFFVGEEAAAAIRSARRTVAVGTTSVRVLESCARMPGGLRETSGTTDIFIYPPFEFQAVDLMLTNFHLPKSTLLMLVSAFAGRELILAAYREAVAAGYRFFSYGDCMLIR